MAIEKRATTYYVENTRLQRVLDKGGNWVRLNSYGAKRFATRDEATAAFPAGVDCQVLTRNEVVE